jgi:hypothetical protein
LIFPPIPRKASAGKGQRTNMALAGAIGAVRLTRVSSTFAMEDITCTTSPSLHMVKPE